MSEWSLRLQTPTSQLTAQLPHGATIKVLREHVAALTGLDDPVLKCGFPPVPPKPHLARVECPTTDGTPPRVCLYRSDRPPRRPCCTTCEAGSRPAAAAPVVTADPPTIDLLGP